MPISVKCKCGKGLKVRDDLAGKAIRCPGCGAVVKVVGEGAPVSGRGKPAVPGKPSTSVKPRPSTKSMPATPQKPGAPTSKPADLGLLGLPDDIMPKIDAAPTEKCPKCGALFYKGDIFCTACGLDFKTGKPVPQRKVRRSLWWVKALVVLVIVGAICYFVHRKFFGPKDPKDTKPIDRGPVEVDRFAKMREVLEANPPDPSAIAEALAEHGLDAIPFFQEILREAKHHKVHVQLGLAHAIATLTSVSLYNDEVSDLAGRLLEKEDNVEVFKLVTEALLSMANGAPTEPITHYAIRPIGSSNVETVYGVKFGDKKASGPNEQARTLLLNNRNFLDLPTVLRIAETFFAQSEVQAVELLIHMALHHEENVRTAGMSGLQKLLGFTKAAPELWRDWWSSNRNKNRYQWWLDALTEASDEERCNIFALIKNALGELAPEGEEYEYSTTASAEEKDAVIRRWQEWWEENQMNEKIR